MDCNPANSDLHFNLSRSRTTAVHWTERIRPMTLKAEGMALLAQNGRIFSKQREKAGTVYEMFTFGREMGSLLLPTHFHSVKSIHSEIPATSNLNPHAQ